MKNMLIEVEITGNTPLMQHRFGGDSTYGTPEPVPTTPKSKGNNGGGIRITNAPKLLPREEAELGLYKASNGTFVHPGAALFNMIINAGANFKLPAMRKSAKYVVPQAVRVLDDALVILDPATNKPAKQWEVDSRSVVIPATKGRIMRHRPRWDAWRMRANITVDTEVLSPGFVQELLEYGGAAIGIGDYRPNKGGTFGCFRVTQFKETATQ